MFFLESESSMSEDESVEATGSNDISIDAEGSESETDNTSAVKHDQITVQEAPAANRALKQPDPSKLTYSIMPISVIGIIIAIIILVVLLCLTLS